MMRLVEENWTNRYHLYIDIEATQLDAIAVNVASGLSPCAVFARPNEDQPQLIESGVTTLRALRALTPKLLHVGCAHLPFARLTLTSRQRCIDDVDELVNWALAEGSQSHDDRVQSLCKLYDLYERQLGERADAAPAAGWAH